MRVGLPHCREKRRHAVNENLDFVKAHGLALGGKIEIFVIYIVHLDLCKTSLIRFFDRLFVTFLLH
jgi:hypothetical protein